jgi:hypothetical protein
MAISSPLDPAPDPMSPRDATPGLRCRVELLPVSGSRVTVLFLAGELDISTHAYAATVLGDALTGLTFCSVSGLGLLGRPTATDAGHRYALAGLSAHLSRAAAVVWPTDTPARYPGTEVAIEALCG